MDMPENGHARASGMQTSTRSVSVGHARQTLRCQRLHLSGTAGKIRNVHCPELSNEFDCRFMEEQPVKLLLPSLPDMDAAVSKPAALRLI